ncbi:UNVERIFIED_CONTAM: hypothetical protein Sindi_2933400, partial [Sesamum indicum]
QVGEETNLEDLCSTFQYNYLRSSYSSPGGVDVQAQAEKYMNLEDAWLVKKYGRDKRKEGNSLSTHRAKGEPRDQFNPLDSKNDHYTPPVTSLARMLMAIDRHPALQWPKV